VSRWPWLSANLRWLLAARGVRSFSQAFVTVSVPLYLAAAGYSTPQVGFLLSLGSVGAGLLIVAVGLGADRFGRRRSLVGLALLATLGCPLYSVSTSFWPLAVGAALATVGRGGTAGSGERPPQL